jgi:hypothetical protein
MMVSHPATLFAAWAFRIFPCWISEWLFPTSASSILALSLSISVLSAYLPSFASGKELL